MSIFIFTTTNQPTIKLRSSNLTLRRVSSITPSRPAKQCSWLLTMTPSKDLSFNVAIWRSLTATNLFSRKLIKASLKLSTKFYLINRTRRAWELIGNASARMVKITLIIQKVCWKDLLAVPRKIGRLTGWAIFTSKPSTIPA